MYSRSAHIYDHYYSFKDYDAEAEKLRRLLYERHPAAVTLLDLGCGTGKHLERLQKHYRVEGLDLNPELISIARARCPDVPFHVGDMTDFALGRRFDVVMSLFSVIGFVKTVENLRRALACIARHVNPGGLVLIEPWFTPECYWTGRITANFVDEPDLKIAWMYVSERRDLMSVMKMHYLVGTPAGVEHFTEVHELGLFTRDECASAFNDVGLSVDYDPVGIMNRGLYIGSSRSG